MRGLLLVFLGVALTAPASFAQAPAHNLRDYGAVLDGVSANGEDDNALEAAITAARSGVGSSTVWWRGPLTLRRPPPIVSGLQLEGDGILSASVRKVYPGGVLFRVERPASGNLGGHTALRNFSVPQDVGTAGSYTILARADSSWSPHSLSLENLYLGNGSGPGPFRTIELNGSAYFLGLRQPRIHNVTCFGSSAAANVYFTGTVDLFATCLRVYPAGGTYGDVFWGPGNTGQFVY